MKRWQLLLLYTTHCLNSWSREALLCFWIQRNSCTYLDLSFPIPANLTCLVPHFHKLLLRIFRGFERLQVTERVHKKLAWSPAMWSGISLQLNFLAYWGHIQERVNSNSGNYILSPWICGWRASPQQRYYHIQNSLPEGL